MTAQPRRAALGSGPVEHAGSSEWGVGSKGLLLLHRPQESGQALSTMEGREEVLHRDALGKPQPWCHSCLPTQLCQCLWEQLHPKGLLQVVPSPAPAPGGAHTAQPIPGLQLLPGEGGSGWHICSWTKALQTDGQTDYGFYYIRISEKLRAMFL